MGTITSNRTLALVAMLVSAVATVGATPATAKSSPGWSNCAGENEVCLLGGSFLVRYGARGVYAFRRVNGGFICGKKLFGDPLPGVTKECDFQCKPGSC